MDDSDIQALIRDLGSGDWEIIKKAVEKLVEIGKPAVSALIEFLKDEDSGLRPQAAEVLGKIGDTRAVPALIDALNDCASYMYENAALALGMIAEKHPEYNWSTAVPSLISALNDYDVNVQLRAAWALAKIGEPTVPVLLLALRVEDLSTRRSIWQPAGWALVETAKKTADKGDYTSALKIIKDSTTVLIKKKDRNSLKERRIIVEQFAMLTTQIHDKMNSIDNDKKFPVKHQPVRTLRKKVMTNG